MPITSTFNR